jgi:hypothetical protein
MEQLIPWTVLCLLVLALCLAKPGAGRIFLGLFFLVMAIGVNVVLVFVAPDQFIALGADSYVPFYRWGFQNVVALAPPLFGLLAAAFEITTGLMILGRGRRVKWGLAAAVVFLLAITPLGIWTLGNPLMALAAAALMRRDYDRSLREMLGALIRSRRGTTVGQVPGRT